MLFINCNRFSYRFTDYEDDEKRDEERERERDDFATGADAEGLSVFLLSKITKNKSFFVETRVVV